MKYRLQYGVTLKSLQSMLLCSCTMYSIRIQVWDYKTNSSGSTRWLDQIETAVLKRYCYLNPADLQNGQNDQRTERVGSFLKHLNCRSAQLDNTNNNISHHICCRFAVKSPLTSLSWWEKSEWWMHGIKLFVSRLCFGFLTTQMIEKFILERNQIVFTSKYRQGRE